MAKRKMSRKQRAAALRNLAKARRAKKRPARAASPKRRPSRRRHKRARENGFGGFAQMGQPAPKKRAKKRSGGRRRKARLSPAARKRRAGKKYRTYVRKAYTSKKGIHYPKRRIRKRLRRHAVKPYSYSRKGRTVHVKRHMSYEKRNPVYAFENPLSAGEVVVGGLVGLFGYATSSFFDRLLATHALKATTDTSGTQLKDASGVAAWTDAPAAGQVYNVFAVDAPMDWKRWAAGLAPGLVAIGLSRWVSNPMGRTTVQFFGFGYTLRTLGKGSSDLMGWLLRKTGLGQQLYAAELNAHIALRENQKAQSAPPPMAAVPSALTTGLGRALGMGGLDHPGTDPGVPGRVAPPPPPPNEATPPPARTGGSTPVDQPPPSFNRNPPPPPIVARTGGGEKSDGCDCDPAPPTFSELLSYGCNDGCGAN